MPAQRRSTLVALTSEQETFLKPPDVQVLDPDNTVAAAFATSKQPPMEQAPQRFAPARKSRPASPAAKRGLALHSVTLRLSPAVVHAMRRAAAERSLDYVEPFSQQAIVESALREWLSRNGFAVADAGD